ncbi:hypothetical protein C8J56DRAFT_1045667 [Mycena floridula]|nr:hypothetical protein C8J56DRAFT_1045667 [Mycena floridula]
MDSTHFIFQACISWKVYESYSLQKKAEVTAWWKADYATNKMYVKAVAHGEMLPFLANALIAFYNAFPMEALTLMTRLEREKKYWDDLEDLRQSYWEQHSFALRAHPEIPVSATRAAFQKLSLKDCLRDEMLLNLFEHNLRYRPRHRYIGHEVLYEINTRWEVTETENL